ncbi:unnamed protein product [Amoebophrya sp. A25]|nr:unnamed protein product [Amoebophrya sp. A25]|eukprot:GSA25T00013599001.1
MALVSSDNDSSADEHDRPIAPATKKRLVAGGAKASSFVSKKVREEREAQEVQKQKEEQKKREVEATRKRKQFLLQDPRDAERNRERAEREYARKLREEERRARANGSAENGNANMVPLGNGTSHSTSGGSSSSSSRAATSSGAIKNVAAVSSLKNLGLLSKEKYDQVSTQEKANSKSTSMSAQELYMVKKQYLGLRDERRKLQKPSEKFRNIFNFEWAAEDDTFRGDSNELYTKRPEPQLLYGRGYRAGIDVREQRKANSFYEEMVAARAEATGEDVSNFLSSREAIAQKKENAGREEDGRHWTVKSLDEMKSRDWMIFREDHQIKLQGGRVPPPLRNWQEAPLPVELLEAVSRCNYTKPMPVQMQAIPVACALRDLIAVAETGSGKTAAYSLPLLKYLHNLPQLDHESAQNGPYALILCPSHELAFQIEKEMDKFKHFIPHIRRVTLVGGQGGRDAERQAFDIRNGVELIIATPGRLVDAINKRHTVLHQCNYVILDEADRMLAPGLQEFLYQALDAIPSTNLKAESEDHAYKQELEGLAGHRSFRITQMYGATINAPMERLAKKYCRHPAVIRVGDPSSGNKNIEQRVKMMPEADKKKELESLIGSVEMETPCMIFVNQKKAAELLAKTIDQLGYKAATMHSGKLSSDRQAALEKFRSGQLDFLVATDVAARGIDIEGLPHVLNFDMPTDFAEYKQRIGRTGRAGRKGVATTFLTPADETHYFELKEYLIACEKPVPTELSLHEASRFKPGTITESGHMQGQKSNVVYSSTYK